MNPLPVALKLWQQTRSDSELAPITQTPLAKTPEVLGDNQEATNRHDLEPLPPCRLVAGAMQLAVMGPADRDCEFVAHASSQCTRLGKGEVMGIRWDAAAHKAGLPKHEPAVLLVA
jgi:hypothetical protein